MVRPLSKIPENEARRGPKPGAYDADGFLVDDDDEVLSATAFPKVTLPSHVTDNHLSSWEEAQLARTYISEEGLSTVASTWNAVSVDA